MIRRHSVKANKRFETDYRIIDVSMGIISSFDDPIYQEQLIFFDRYLSDYSAKFSDQRQSLRICMHSGVCRD